MIKQTRRLKIIHNSSGLKKVNSYKTPTVINTQNKDMISSVYTGDTEVYPGDKTYVISGNAVCVISGGNVILTSGNRLEIISMFMLYTDIDENITEYVRKYFDDLYVLSGNKIILYIIEHSLIRSKHANVSNLHIWVSHKAHDVLSTLGIKTERPYDKTNIYNIARSLNVSEDNIPCIVVSSDFSSLEENIIVPIPEDDLGAFFRSFFSSVNNIINTELSNMYPVDSKKIILDRIRSIFHMKHTYSSDKPDKKSVVYNYNGDIIINNGGVITNKSSNVLVKDIKISRARNE